MRKGRRSRFGRLLVGWRPGGGLGRAERWLLRRLVAGVRIWIAACQCWGPLAWIHAQRRTAVQPATIFHSMWPMAISQQSGTLGRLAFPGRSNRGILNDVRLRKHL